MNIPASEVEQGVEQTDASTSIPSNDLLDCLLLVAHLEGKTTSRASVSSGLPLEDGKLPVMMFNRAASRAGLASTMLSRELDEIPVEVLPAILILKNGDAVVLTDINHEQKIAIVVNPSTHLPSQVDYEQLTEECAGHVFYLRPMQHVHPKFIRKAMNTGFGVL